MSIELWWGSGSTPAWRALLGFAVKGVPYASHLLSFSEGDTQKPEFLAVNPRGKVPAIRDGDFTLGESLAILAWLDRKVPEPPLFGRTPEEHGRIWRSCLEYEYYGSTRFDAVVRPIFRGLPLADDAIPALHEELAALERALSGGWLVGDSVSAADIVWFAAVALVVRAATRPAAKALNLGLYPLGERYPAILAWTRRIQAIPGFEDTVPPHWREGEAPIPSPFA